MNLFIIELQVEINSFTTTSSSSGTEYTNEYMGDSDELLSFRKGGMLMVMLTAAEDGNKML